MDSKRYEEAYVAAQAGVTLSSEGNSLAREVANTAQFNYGRMLVKQGTRFAQSGLYDNAVHSFTSATKVEPKEGSHFAYLASALMDSKRYEEAYVAAQAGVASSPKDNAFVNRVMAEAQLFSDGGGHLSQGMAYARIQEFDKAAASFAAAVKLKPTNGRMYANLATALVDAKRYIEAQTAAKNGVRFSADGDTAQKAYAQTVFENVNGHARFYIGESEDLRLGNWFSIDLESAPQNQETSYSLFDPAANHTKHAIDFYANGDMLAAFRSFRAAVWFAPSAEIRAKSMYNLALVYADMADTERAIESLRVADALFPHQQEVSSFLQSLVP